MSPIIHILFLAVLGYIGIMTVVFGIIWLVIYVHHRYLLAKQRRAWGSRMRTMFLLQAIRLTLEERYDEAARAKKLAEIFR